jgi:translation initiation factor 2B subunit (eIF-2B alpha/beta/delta family)
MAPLWNAALHATAARRVPAAFDRFVRQAARASDALLRTGVGALVPEPAIEHRPLPIVTLSASGAVRGLVLAVHARQPVELACAESRPGLEGRTLAADLAARGVPVALYADAAIAHALRPGGLVLVGADAIGPAAFLNKSGTRMLAAAAAAQGIAVYVAATRDKFVMPALWPHLTGREGGGEEIWADAPAGITVRNPYFEPTPIDLITAVVSDIGLLGAGEIPRVCGGMQTELMEAALEELIG